MNTITNYTQNIKILYLLSFLFCLLSISCNNDDEYEVQANYPIEVEYETLKMSHLGYNANLYSEIENLNYIINDEVSWNNLIIETEMLSLNNIEIDFNTYTLIAIFSELKLQTGYYLKINNILEYQGKIEIRNSTIDNGAFFSALSVPFVIIKIPKTTKPIEFIAE